MERWSWNELVKGEIRLYDTVAPDCRSSKISFSTKVSTNRSTIVIPIRSSHVYGLRAEDGCNALLGGMLLYFFFFAFFAPLAAPMASSSVITYLPDRVSW